MDGKPNGYLSLSLDKRPHNTRVGPNDQAYIQNPNLIPDDYLLIILTDIECAEENVNEMYGNIMKILESKRYHYCGNDRNSMYFTNMVAGFEYKIFNVNTMINRFDICPKSVRTQQRDLKCLSYTPDEMKKEHIPCIVRAINIADNYLVADFTFKPIIRRNPNERWRSYYLYYLMEKREYNVKAAIHKK